MNTAEVLRAAAERVKQQWCRFDFNDGHGGACAMGALYAIARSRDSYPAVQALADAINWPHGRSFTAGTNIMLWNDSYGQTQENVAATMEYAAICWEEQQKQDQLQEVAVTA